MRIFHLAAVATAVLSVAACSPKQTPEQASSSSASASEEKVEISVAASAAASKAVTGILASTDYVGKWTGPEGTSLTITPQGNDYQVVVQNLDGPRTFSGQMKDKGLTFVRDGVPFLIKKGDGAATGMKWLADKKDCLIVTTGEGYCRD